jgi:WXG100 family type VII secretion target
MAKPDVRMNYDSMEAMAKEFDNAVKQIEDTMNDMKKVASTMQDGALLGTGGDAFVDAIQSHLLPSLQTLSEKFGEMGGDIRAAVAYTRDGVESSRKKFI